MKGFRQAEGIALQSLRDGALYRRCQFVSAEYKRYARGPYGVVGVDLSRKTGIVPRLSKSAAQYPGWARPSVSNHLTLSDSRFQASYITTVCTTRHAPFHNQYMSALAARRSREWRASPPARQLPRAERSLHAQDVTSLLARLPPRLSTTLETRIRVLAFQPASLHQTASCAGWSEVREGCEGCVCPVIIYVSGSIVLPCSCLTIGVLCNLSIILVTCTRSLKYSGIWPRHSIT